MDKDDFAQFIADQIKSVKHYSFDFFYDITKIMGILAEKRSDHVNKHFSTFYLFVRDTGCDLAALDDVNYDIYKDRSSVIYEINFFWNHDYFSDFFCTVKQI